MPATPPNDIDLSEWLEVLLRQPAVDGSTVVGATIGGMRIEFDSLHRALAKRINDLTEQSRG